MLPSEMIILMAMVKNQNTGKELSNRPMDVTGGYIGYLYDTLVNRGYLNRHKSTGYQLTALGRKSISEFLQRNKFTARDIVRRLRLLGIKTNPTQEKKLDNIDKEAIKLK